MKYLWPAMMVALLCYPNETMAWGPRGHRLVGMIASTQLKPAVKDSIAKYLGNESLEEASTWMDDVRSDTHYDYQKPWHYINIDKGGTYSDTSTNNIIWAIHNAEYEIEHRGKYSKEQIATDIKILCHLVGDIHQPLHCGYADDQGGNTVTVFVDNTASNLHRVWDTNIIEDWIVNEPVTWANLSKYTPEEIAEMKDTNVIDWLNESRSYLDEIYDFKGDNITRQYIERNKPIIEKRLLYAGIRLGRLLNRVFAH